MPASPSVYPLIFGLSGGGGVAGREGLEEGRGVSKGGGGEGSTVKFCLCVTNILVVCKFP